MLLAVLGGALGLLLAFWAKDLLLAVSPADFPQPSEVSIDGGVLLFSLLVTLFAGLALGLAPAIQNTRSDLNSELKASMQTTFSPCVCHYPPRGIPTVRRSRLSTTRSPHALLRYQE
jgi:hypothetical protein